MSTSITGKPASPAQQNWDLERIIHFIRNRWRLRVALRGFAVALGLGFLVVLAAAYAMDYFRFAPTAVLALKLTAYLTIAAFLVVFLIIPLRRRVSDQRVALYLEEHEPSLQAAVVSAVEASRESPNAVSPALIRRLVEQAAEVCRTIDYGRRIEHDRLRRVGGWLALVIGFCALVLWLNPAFLRFGAPFLFSWDSAAASVPYELNVSPGDTRIPLGDDQLIGAQSVNFKPRQIELVSKYDADDDWQRQTMTPGAEDGTYEIFLFDVAAAVDYYVEADGVRSPTYRIEVVEVPEIRRISLVYHFPEYSGLDPRTVEDGGDIVPLCKVAGSRSRSSRR